MAGEAPATRPEPPCVQWKLAAFPSEARTRMHLKAKDVPTFPNENPRLREAKNWPTMVRIGGQACSLRISEQDYDVVKRVQSLSEISPRNRYCLHYEAAPQRGRSSTRGPFYCWSQTASGPWLTERSWEAESSHGESTETYLYYPSGELLMYECTRRWTEGLFSKRDHREHVEEAFNRSGCLLVFGYWKDNEPIGTFYLGRPVDPIVLSGRKVALIGRANSEAGLSAK